MKKKWMIYGANGYTGKLLAEEAIRRGHQPVLAGRSLNKLKPLTEDLGLEYKIFDLNDEKAILKSIQDFDLVFNAAGPYKYTNTPLVKACLSTGTNYLDITGEIPVFEENFTHKQQAKDQDIAIISGVGFDVIPTDCMAKYVSEKIPNPKDLEIGIVAIGNPSPGTLKTMIEHMSEGTLIRRNGQLVKPPQGKIVRKIRFMDKEREVRAVSWGDLSTAYRTTGIPNITTYMPFPEKLADLLKSRGVGGDDTSKSSGLNELMRWVEKNVKGLSEKARKEGTSHIWVQVKNDEGDTAQAWLKTMEGYRFTSIAGIKCVEKLFEMKPKGVLTPSLAFGADLVLELPETRRVDSLD